MVPGGGIEPPWSCLRRILSLFFEVLQRVAADRKVSHKPFDLRMLRVRLFLHSVAAKCTKVGNEQPSKRPPESAPKVRQIDQKHGGFKQPRSVTSLYLTQEER